ncbi:Cytochrome P450 CYP2 subfamily [Handroanthus impetiginosus]|uniref:Cytochrome P450 CYP2 subfamily n=1 Tax=Handroanthus impetiginosus TaxID=429701 RepID=A0A2G9H402_9LAMI|nr:Cytochrome P450 CYP2 subfamily [Handroanthus impetiginosus]
MAWVWAAFSAILFFYLLQKLLSPKTNKKFPPGPVGLPIFGHFHLLSKNPHQDLYNLAQKYGPIMGLRFGFVPTVVVSSPAAAELFLKTHDLIFASRPKNDFSIYIGYGQRDIVFGPYGPYWRNMRKLCTLELLSNTRINQFQTMRKSEVELTVNSLKEASEKGEIVDLSAKIVALNRDMTCLMVCGKKYDDGDLDEKGFKAVIAETMEIGAKFNVADYFPYIGVLDLQGLNRKLKDLSRIFDGFLEKIIDEHIKKKKKKKKKEDEDIVDTMMAIMESGEAEFQFDRRHVKAVLLDLLVAGMDTSATAVDWALSELIRHPQIMEKLQKELETVVGLDHMVEESHLDKLEYLDCVVKETLRLHPVAPLLVPHESMEESIINGYHIPKKSRIMVNVWAIGRDPSVWPNPDTFSPDRFIGSSIDLRGCDFELIPFGSGRRGCPGLQLGLTIVRLVLAQLVHCFDWKLPSGKKPSDLDMSEHFGIVTSRDKHLMAIPCYRLGE